MKKISLLLVVICMSFFIAPSFVFAADIVPFNIIVSETDDFNPENEYSITFNDEIMINAETVKGAKINVAVFYGDVNAKPVEPQAGPTVFDEVVVGATCKFIAPISLVLGDNKIMITVEKDGFAPASYTYVVKRKDDSLLKSLQSIIVIPSAVK